METWKYNYKDGGFELAKDLHSDFGNTDFMEMYYSAYSSIPDCGDNVAGECVEGGMIVWELKNRTAGEFPGYVVDLQYGDGDTLCFRSAWELWQWLSSVMPMIMYVKSWNEQIDPKYTR
jgi:hypothetical protein